CHDAGDGWPAHVCRIAQTRGYGESYIHLGIYRGRLRASAARRGFQFPAKTLQSKAVDRGRERQRVTRQTKRLATPLNENARNLSRRAIEQKLSRSKLLQCRLCNRKSVTAADEALPEWPSDLEENLS